MQAVPYASVVGSLQYAQVSTRPDLTFVTGLLGRYQSNPGMEHWNLVKKVLSQILITQEMIESLPQGIYSLSRKEPYHGRAQNKQ